jgi:hypothetical protein
VVEFLFSLFELGIQNADAFFGNRFVDITTVAAIVGEFVGIFRIDANIIHVVAFITEFHDRLI